MGVLDNLSKELKECTTIYSDVLVGLHNDVNKYKKEVSTQKTKTESALKKIDLLLIEGTNTASSNNKTLNKITLWDEKFKKEKVVIGSHLRQIKKAIDDYENFIEIQSKKVTQKQEEIEKLLKENNFYFNEKLELLNKTKENFNIELGRINVVQLEQKRNSKELIELKQENEKLINRIKIQENGLKANTKKLNTNLIVLYVLCFLLLLVSVFLFFK